MRQGHRALPASPCHPRARRGLRHATNDPRRQTVSALPPGQAARPGVPAATAPPGHRAFPAGTASGPARRTDACRDPRTVSWPGAVESRGTPVRVRRTGDAPPGPAMSCVRRRTCRPRRAKGRARRAPRRLGCRSAHRRMRECRTIGALRTMLHVRELIAQCGNAPLPKSISHRCHEWMVHASPGAMREHVAGLCPRRHRHETGDAVPVIDRNRNACCRGGIHAATRPLPASAGCAGWQAAADPETAMATTRPRPRPHRYRHVSPRRSRAAT
jgi:hypothetical protein